MASIFKHTLASVTGLGLILGLATAPAWAQINGGFEDHSGDSDSNEVFGGSGVTLTDLMRNASRARGISSDEFNRQSDRNIDEAAADFRQRQQESLEAEQGAIATPDLEEQI